MSRAEAITKRVVDKLATEIEREYRAERGLAAERLHNAFAVAIRDQKPSVETILYVLQLLQWSILDQRNHELFTPGGDVPNGMEQNITGN